MNPVVEGSAAAFCSAGIAALHCLIYMLIAAVSHL